jgi:hypothetical protein
MYGYKLGHPVPEDKIMDLVLQIVDRSSGLTTQLLEKFSNFRDLY